MYIYIRGVKLNSARPRVAIPPAMRRAILGFRYWGLGLARARQQQSQNRALGQRINRLLLLELLRQQFPACLPMGKANGSVSPQYCWLIRQLEYLTIWTMLPVFLASVLCFRIFSQGYKFLFGRTFVTDAWHMYTSLCLSRSGYSLVDLECALAFRSGLWMLWLRADTDKHNSQSEHSNWFDKTAGSSIVYWLLDSSNVSQNLCKLFGVVWTDLVNAVPLDSCYHVAVIVLSSATDGQDEQLSDAAEVANQAQGELELQQPAAASEGILPLSQLVADSSVLQALQSMSTICITPKSI